MFVVLSGVSLFIEASIRHLVLFLYLVGLAFCHFPNSLWRWWIQYPLNLCIWSLETLSAYLDPASIGYQGQWQRSFGECECSSSNKIMTAVWLSDFGRCLLLQPSCSQSMQHQSHPISTRRYVTKTVGTPPEQLTIRGMLPGAPSR